ncbi:MAG TPA: hypothetical protein VJ044_15630, partial [Candidatus Hodarchaeales archaeon]|nr:hypothetical protein [Candidatus Hodarchaeales archaeon]
MVSLANERPELTTSPETPLEQPTRDRPKFELTTIDVVEPVTLGDCFWEKKDGKSFGWKVKHRGEDKVWFVTKGMNTILSDYGEGESLLVCLRQKGIDKYPYLEVRGAIFDLEGKDPAPKPTD